MRSVLRLVTAVILGLAMTVAAASAASAKPDEGGAGTSEPVGSVCSINGAFDYQYLPVERWSGATQVFHLRSNGGLIPVAQLDRNLQSVTFSIGDFLYGTTVKFVTWSTQFCPLQTVGGAVDDAAARLGEALLNSALIAGLVIVTIIVLLAHGIRSGGGAWVRRLLTKVAVLALFGVMVAGSIGSTGGGIDGDFETEYDPGMGSPGWFATTIDDVITQLAAAPAAALSAEAVLGTPNGGVGDELNCQPYLSALQEGYTAQATQGAVLASEAMPALTVSNLWQISSYNAWSVAQFGNKNMNGHDRVACRMLDRTAAIPVGIGSFPVDGQGTDTNEQGIVTNLSAATVTDVMSRVPANNLGLRNTAQWVKPGAPAWRPLPNAEADKGWIAWATCVPKDAKIQNLILEDGWKAPPGNKWLIADEGAREGSETVNGSEKLNEACYAFFNTPGTTVDNIFDWGEGDKELKKYANEMPASIYNFIGSLHGSNTVASSAAGISYLLSAVGVAVVYGGLGIAILLVKIMAVVMLFSVFFALTMVLLANADNQKLIRFTKEFVGLSLMAAFAVFIMSLVTLFVKIIWLLIGNFTGGPNSLMTMLVGGLAPVIAAIALHQAFKAIGMPSPMTIKGATSWGQALAGGAATGAVAAGVSKIADGARSIGRRAGSGAKGKLTDGMMASRGVGTKNADIASPQKSDVGAAAVKRTSEDVLKDPAATAEDRNAAMDEIDQRQNEHERVLSDPRSTADQKRAAQRALSNEKEARGKEQDVQKNAAKEARAERKEERGRAKEARSTMTPEELWKDRRARAGHQLSKLGGGAWSATKNRGHDAQRWMQSAKANPKRALKRAGVTATVIGAASLGGLPVLAAVGGIAGARKVRSVIKRKAQNHALRQRHQLADYRRRQAAGGASTEEPDNHAPTTAPRTPAPRPSSADSNPEPVPNDWGNSVADQVDPPKSDWQRMPFDRDRNRNRGL